jgi:hypothetical protein
MASPAPRRLAYSGKPAAGYTTSDDPTTMQRSQASISAWARAMAASGMAWPKEMVADLMIPPQRLQGSTRVRRRNWASRSAIS